MNKQTLKLKIILVVLLFAVVSLSSFFVWGVWSFNLDTRSAQALKNAKIAETAFLKDDLQKLNAEQSDLGKKEYQDIKNALTNIKQTDEEARFAYIYVKKGDKLYFIADSEGIDSKDYSPPGQEYTEASSQYFIPFTDGQDLITDPATDRWGKWVSVLVPIKNLKTGEVLAVFAMDYPANKWSNVASLLAAQAGVIALLIITVFVFALVVINSNSKGREKENKLQSIITGTNAGTWEWNIQTGETVFNERWAEIIGYTLEELQPISIKTWEKFAHPDDLVKSDELLKQHFQGKLKNYSFDSRMKHKNGSWVWVYDNGRITEWDKEGKPLKMFGTHLDITKIKLTEEKLSAKNEELERLNKMMVGRELKMIEMKEELEKLRNNKI